MATITISRSDDGMINDEIGIFWEGKKEKKKYSWQKLDWNSNFADNEFSKTKNIDRGLVNHDWQTRLET